MILLVHQKGHRVVKAMRNGAQLPVSVDPCLALWQLAGEFPEENILWVEEDLEWDLEPEVAEKSISHERMMVSYAVQSKFLPESIGYVDQLPFININPEVRYPTWRMSSDVGGMKGKTLLSFEKEFKSIRCFDYLLNSLAKVGQQNGLFCYSDPGLLEIPNKNVGAISRAGDAELFSFVYSHYKSIWVFVLFFCLGRYENRYPVWALLRSLFTKKVFGKQVDLPEISQPGDVKNVSVDVIIPSIGRPQYLQQVVKDLSLQRLLPKRVIIVEQNPESNSVSELTEMLGQEWPFEITHIFTHETGACRARNRALNKVRSEWIFFSDDDQRIEKDFLKLAIEKIYKFEISCITTSYLQQGENKIFKKVKQWGTFGAGNSVVSNKFASNIRFNEKLEYGYGEDMDYGMKLRNSGCDIIYDPDLEIMHLKAPVGGFRKEVNKPWQTEVVVPKPSPTLMQYMCKYYSKEQIIGFRLKMLLEFYSRQNIKNPYKYLKDMEARWQSSKKWANHLSLNSCEKV